MKILVDIFILAFKNEQYFEEIAKYKETPIESYKTAYQSTLSDMKNLLKDIFENKFEMDALLTTMLLVAKTQEKKDEIINALEKFKATKHLEKVVEKMEAAKVEYLETHQLKSA